MILAKTARITLHLGLTFVLLGTAALAQTSADAPAQDPRITSLLASLQKTRTPTSAAISPDGHYVAWTLAGRGGAQLHLTGLAPAGAAQDGAWDRVLSPDTIADTTNSKPGLCVAGWPVWSPDGKQLAFLSNCDQKGSSWEATEQYQIFTWTTATNAVRQLTHVHGEITSPAWSPDGRSIAFLFVENATRSAGATSAMKPWAGVIGEDGMEIQRVYGVDVSSGLGAWISADTKLHIYEFSWSPDSNQIIYVAATPPGENNWWVARLFVQHVGTINCIGDSPCAGLWLPNGIPKVIVDTQKISGPLHGLQIAVPRFSPDGKQIAFIGGLMSDQGSTGGDIYLIPATGGEPKDITPNRAASAAYIAWLGPTTLGVAEHVGGSSHLTKLDTVTGKDLPGTNVTFPESIGAGGLAMNVSIANNGSIALIRSSYEHPPEVWAGPDDHLQQISHLNDALKPAWGKSESIDWTNEGYHVQGWLLYPANYDSSKKYPLIVDVHGGPSSAVTPGWPRAGYGGVPFSALGYFVFFPNPRGSYGQGEAFTQANKRDFGYGDLRDILAGMDVLEKRFPIDKNREGLTGWSYGGFMTMFGITQTTRFRAAVAGAGISDWKSYYGENSIDQWMLPFFGASVYDDPAIYAKSSAIDSIKNVKTPTLIVVGDRDGECPAPQSFELWHALRAEGVKTQLVVYPDEGHHFSNPEHNLDVLQRALNWFEAEMPAAK